MAQTTNPADKPDAGQPEEGDEVVLFDAYPPLVTSVGQLLVAVLTVGLALLYFWVKSRSVHYRITTQRIVIETGLLSKRMDQVDVYRINDYVVERPFAQRIVGTGNIVLSAMDRSTPNIRLYGLKTDVMALYEKLRKATESEKRRRGVRVLDNEVSH